MVGARARLRFASDGRTAREGGRGGLDARRGRIPWIAGEGARPQSSSAA